MHFAKERFVNYKKEIEGFSPLGEQEISDHKIAVDLLGKIDMRGRGNSLIHLTASTFVLNPERTKTLMIYHNIYNSWSWAGGHGDGMEDQLEVGIKELQEETGVERFKIIQERPIALDIIPVKSHIRKGKFVSAHLHLNLTYLLEVSEKESLRIKEDENQDIGWIPLDQIEDFVTEEHMLPIYKKIIDKSRKKGNICL